MAGLAAGASYPHDQSLTIRQRSSRPSHSDEVQTVMIPRRDRFWLLAALLFGLLYQGGNVFKVVIAKTFYDIPCTTKSIVCCAIG